MNWRALRCDSEIENLTTPILNQWNQSVYSEGTEHMVEKT